MPPPRPMRDCKMDSTIQSLKTLGGMAGRCGGGTDCCELDVAADVCDDGGVDVDTGDAALATMPFCLCSLSLTLPC